MENEDDKKDNEVYLYFTDIHARMLGIHDQYSAFKICNAFYALSNDMDLGRIQPPDLQEHINNFHDIELSILTDLIEQLTVDEMEELQSMFEANDRLERIYPHYATLSSEYLFLDAIHRHVQPDSNELLWLLESKMHVVLRLLTEPSPYNDGKMGLPIEASQVIRSLTGYRTDGTDEVMQKTRSIFSVLALTALNKLSYVLSNENTADESNPVLPENENGQTIVNYPPTFFERCRYYNNSDFSVHDDPYATVFEQQEIVKKLMQFTQNIKNSPQSIFIGSVNRAVHKIQDNIRRNEKRVSSTMHFNLS